MEARCGDRGMKYWCFEYNQSRNEIMIKNCGVYIQVQVSMYLHIMVFGNKLRHVVKVRKSGNEAIA